VATAHLNTHRRKRLRIVCFRPQKRVIGENFQFMWFLSVVGLVTMVQTERADGFCLTEGARNRGFYGRGHEAAVGTGCVVFQPAFGRKWHFLATRYWRRWGAKCVIAVHFWWAAQLEVPATGTGLPCKNLWMVPPERKEPLDHPTVFTVAASTL
jgi:hypothetical protein